MDDASVRKLRLARAFFLIFTGRGLFAVPNANLQHSSVLLVHGLQGTPAALNACLTIEPSPDV